jgi:excisionase family DNA binding protein
MPASPFSVNRPYTTTVPTLAMKKRDVAHALDVSVRHVENLIARGELRAIKLGKCCRVRPEDLAAYLDSITAKTGGAAARAASDSRKGGEA